MRKVVLLDGNYLANRSYFATQLVTSYGYFVNMIHGMLNTTLFVNDTLRPDAIIAVFDAPGGSSFRKEMYPKYKATRAARHKDEIFSDQLSRIKKILPMLGIPVVENPNSEADDTVAYLAKKYSSEGAKVFIVSNDGDFLQLTVDKNIVLFHPAKGELSSEDHPDYGVPPEIIPQFKSLVGDSSDEYPGVSRFGKMTARKFLSNPVNWNLNNIFNGKADFSMLTKTMVHRLLTSKAEIFLYLKLATLDPERGKVEVKFPKKDLEAFREECEELEFEVFKTRRWDEFERLPEVKDEN